MRTHRDGFTLVELLVAVVIFGLVAASVNKVFTSQQRLAVAQVEQASVQATVRSASTIAATELWELASSPTGVSDIISFDATGLTYRAMRSLGLACQVTTTQVRVLRDPLYRYRAFVPGQDSLLLFVERNPNISSDDTWLPLRITSISSGSTCGPSAAISLHVDEIDTLTTPLSAIVLQAPVRTFEVMELRPVTVGTQNWLGARSVSGGEATLLPVAGPVTATGVRFTYLNALGTATAVAGQIRSIQIRLTGESDRAVRTLRSTVVQPVQDSLSTTVTLRNAPLP